MTASTEIRLESLEQEVKLLRRRLALLEGERPRPAMDESVRRRRPAPAAQPAPKPVVTPPPPRAPRWSSLEELLGGRLLALVGGTALLLGVAFFVALAVDRGWIGEGARVLLAGVGSSLLLGLGVWLHERRGRTQASLAAVGTAVAALFLTLAAATALYELVPAAAGLAAAFAVGALATALAVRWSSRTIGGLGIVGALAAPVLVQAHGTEAVLFLIVALAASGAVLVWRRWDWLAVASFAVSTPQIALWALDGTPRPAVLVPVLAAVVGLNVASALGGELRRRAAASPAATLLLSANALVLGALGAIALPHGDGELAGGLWLAGLAVAYGTLAVAAHRSRRLSDATELALAGAAAVLANASFALLVDGWVVTLGFAASALAVAALGRRSGDPTAVGAAVGGQLTLAIVHTLLFDAPPAVIAGGGSTAVGGISALAAVAVSAFGAARLSARGPALWQEALDGLSLLTLAAVTALTLDGTALVAAWSVQALVVAGVARRTGDRVARGGAAALVALAAGNALVFEAAPDVLVLGTLHGARVAAVVVAVAAAALAVARLCMHPWARVRQALDGFALGALVYAAPFAFDGASLALVWCLEAAAAIAVARRTGDAVARYGAIALVGLAATHALLVEAPPTALANGVPALLPAAAVLAALAAVLAGAARIVSGRGRIGLEGLAAAALVHLGSIAIVTALLPGSGLDKAVAQRPQVAVSAFWAALGLTALLVGLRRNGLRWRVAGFGLLALAAGKVFLYDLATLDSLYRAGSFVALGLLLLAAAFGYQKLRTPA